MEQANTFNDKTGSGYGLVSVLSFWHIIGVALIVVVEKGYIPIWMIVMGVILCLDGIFYIIARIMNNECGWKVFGIVTNLRFLLQFAAMIAGAVFVFRPFKPYFHDRLIHPYDFCHEGTYWFAFAVVVLQLIMAIICCPCMCCAIVSGGFGTWIENQQRPRV